MTTSIKLETQIRGKYTLELYRIEDPDQRVYRAIVLVPTEHPTAKCVWAVYESATREGLLKLANDLL